ncbi:hypothetical protein ACGYLM_01520 [Sulfitobacter sp. 1A10445]|uniref:hypothetical protein n=1 Tax=unclassified Sulfitobacter TaxID=196795 RepID=UPI003744D9D3
MAWKYTKLVKAEATDPKKNEGIGIKFIAEFQSGEAIAKLATIVDSKEVFESTIRSIEKRLDKRDADLAELNKATYTLPPEPEEPTPAEPTPEQKEEQELAQAEAELVVAFETEKRNREIEAMALDAPELKAKLDVVNALKAKKVSLKK